MDTGMMFGAMDVIMTPEQFVTLALDAINRAVEADEADFACTSTRLTPS